MELGRLGVLCWKGWRGSVPDRSGRSSGPTSHPWFLLCRPPAPAIAAWEGGHLTNSSQPYRLMATQEPMKDAVQVLVLGNLNGGDGLGWP